jgi:hypothetical protein
MKCFHRLLFMLLLSPLFSLAQTNYKPGYVVTLKGDTLHGFIDYRGWEANPTAIFFKTAIGDSNPQKLTVSDIGFFSVDNVETYKKYAGAISTDITNISHLRTGRSTSFRLDSVFLKILQKGKNVALYSYTDDIKTRFYIGESPDYAPAELVYRIYDDPAVVTNIHGSTVIENTYLKQLFALANKYNVLDDNLTKAFETAGYSEPDLLPIVSKINNISKSAYEKKYAQKSQVNLFASLALNISNTSSPGSSQYTSGGGKSYTSVLPAVSFGINLIPNRNTGKVQLRAELSFAETQFSSTFRSQDPATGVKVTFNQLEVSILPQVIYNFYNTENLKIFAGAGFAIAFFNYSNTYFGNSNPNGSNANFTGNSFYFQTFDNYLMLKAGVQLNKRIEIFFNYFASTPTTRDDYLEFTEQREQIGVNYFFRK